MMKLSTIALAVLLGLLSGTVFKATQSTSLEEGLHYIKWSLIFLVPSLWLGYLKMTFWANR